MQVYDLNKTKAHPYEIKDKNILYSENNFKVRIIELPPNGEMPTCKMESYVIFYAIKGKVKNKFVSCTQHHPGTAVRLIASIKKNSRPS